MIKGRKVYDPLTDTWSTGYWVADDKGNYYPVWQKGAGMERLTQTSNSGGVAFTFDLDITCQPSEARKILNLATKLKEYEDLEEQGRLLKLPCKIGTEVYNITWWDDVQEKVAVKGKTYYRTVHKHKVTKSAFSHFDINNFGKTVFLTKSEAEAKLKELRGGE